MSNRKRVKPLRQRPRAIGEMGTWYHFTSPDHLPRILRDRFLKVVESNVGSPVPSMPPMGEHVGPDVVWLVDTPDLEHSHGLDGSIHDKTAVRFTVKCRAERWRDWSPGRLAHPAWQAAMLRAAGGADAAAHWYVSEVPIPAEQWERIELRQEDGTWLDLTNAGVYR